MSSTPLARGDTTPASEDLGTPFLKGDTVAAIEIVLVLRVLYFLGYLAKRDEFDPFLTHAEAWDESVISKALLFRTLAISEINHSLQQTQL